MHGRHYGSIPSDVGLCAARECQKGDMNKGCPINPGTSQGFKGNINVKDNVSIEQRDDNVS